MSSKNASLSDFATATTDTPNVEEQRQQALAGGARYTGAPTPASDQHAHGEHPRDEHVCQTCGTTLDLHYRRQFGDRHNIVWHCQRGCPQTEDCPEVTFTDMKDGAGARADYQFDAEETHTHTRDEVTTDGSGLPGYMLPGGGN